MLEKLLIKNGLLISNRDKEAMAKTIVKYIKNQELEDKISDERNIKEYQDTFKGV